VQDTARQKCRNVLDDYDIGDECASHLCDDGDEEVSVVARTGLSVFMSSFPGAS
jgi:hypothetical protein